MLKVEKSGTAPTVGNRPGLSINSIGISVPVLEIVEETGRGDIAQTDAESSIRIVGKGTDMGDGGKIAADRGGDAGIDTYLPGTIVILGLRIYEGGICEETHGAGRQQCISQIRFDGNGTGTAIAFIAESIESECGSDGYLIVQDIPDLGNYADLGGLCVRICLKGQ